MLHPQLKNPVSIKSILHTNWPVLALLLPFCVFWIWGLRLIPFHPDESTQLFMSEDFEALLNQPASLFWEPDQVSDLRQRYRELDAPLTRYLLGFARTLAGISALPVDWDWSRSWDENLAAGAYPDTQLSWTGRLAITLLLPLSTLLVYAIGKQINGRWTGIAAAFLFATNPVVLLHGRRAMAEGTLLFGITFATWTLLKARRYPWLAGLGLAIAFNAKQSSLVLLPVGLVASLWTPGQKLPSLPEMIKKMLQLLIVFILVTLALNPLYWRHPMLAGRSALTARTELMSRQAAGTSLIAPEKATDTLARRLFVLFLNLYISPPEYGLVENLAPTQESINRYIATPGHNLFRGIVWGSIFFTLTLIGIYMAMRSIGASSKATTLQAKKQPPVDSSALAILILTSFFMAGSMLLLLHLYWIRYSIPLIPFLCLWIAYALTSIPFPRQKALKTKPGP